MEGHKIPCNRDFSDKFTEVKIVVKLKIVKNIAEVCEDFFSLKFPKLFLLF